MLKERIYRMPAEWEQQSAVQLTWPHAGTDWAPMLDEVTDTYREMAREISRREALIIVAPEACRKDIRKVTDNVLPTSACVRHVAADTNDTWARDHGFITLAPTDAAMPLRLLDFHFNGWGEKFESQLDNAINRQLFDSGTVKGEYVDCLDFVLEGGSIESDGKGTIFTTTGCLTAPHRNEPMTKDEIEARLKKELCAERIVWIDHGQLTGDDTDGHIDTLVRICPDDTIVYVGCDDKDDEQYEELRLMERQLLSLRTLEGKPYRLLKLPMPHPIYDDGERLPATYANYLVVNGAVLVPTYAQPERDKEALATVAQAYNNREIIGIDCRSLIRQHGSLHCCTMQYY